MNFSISFQLHGMFEWASLTSAKAPKEQSANEMRLSRETFAVCSFVQNPKDGFRFRPQIFFKYPRRLRYSRSLANGESAPSVDWILVTPIVCF